MSAGAVRVRTGIAAGSPLIFPRCGSALAVVRPDPRSVPEFEGRFEPFWWPYTAAVRCLDLDSPVRDAM
jgi:hypothetical protein